MVFDPSFKVDKETAKDIYVDMLKGRNFEDMCAQMYYRGESSLLSLSFLPSCFLSFS